MLPEKPTVFLSYAREDIDSARRLYEALSTAGANVWFDKNALNPGQKWESAITRAIRDSRYFLTLLSHEAVSKRGFIQKELREALAVVDEFPDDQIYLIPVRLDECSPSHDRLKELNWVDLFPSWQDGVDRLLKFFSLQVTPSTDHQLGSQPGAVVAIKYEGLYQTIKGDPSEDYWGYLRFYPDGLVLAASSTGTPSQVMSWFIRENAKPYHSSGTWTLDGFNISFSATSTEGTVDYTGKIDANKNTLSLTTYSHINQHRGISEYRFIPTRINQ